MRSRADRYGARLGALLLIVAVVYIGGHVIAARHAAELLTILGAVAGYTFGLAFGLVMLVEALSRFGGKKK